MAIYGRALADALLKNQYLPVFQVQFNESADELLAQMERNSEMIDGAGYVVMGLQYGKSGGISSLATDISTLPTPNPRKQKQARWETKNLAARFMISDKMVEGSQSNAVAFVSALKDLFEKTMIDAKDDLSRQVHGDGTGKLATTAAVTAAATVGVDSVQFLAEGMFVDVVAVDGTTVKNAGLEITAVDDVAKTVTLSAVVTTITTDTLKRASVVVGADVTGLESWFTLDNTICNINRATDKWFNASSIAVGGNISEVVIQKAIDQAKRVGGYIPNYASVSDGVARGFQALLTAQRRNLDVMDLKGGYQALAYVHPKGRLPIVGSKYAKLGTLRLLSLEHWKLAEMGDWHWMDKDGNILSRVANTPAYEATLLKYADLACAAPKAQVQLTGITES